MNRLICATCFLLVLLTGCCCCPKPNPSAGIESVQVPYFHQNCDPGVYLTSNPLQYAKSPGDSRPPCIYFDTRNSVIYP